MFEIVAWRDNDDMGEGTRRSSADLAVAGAIATYLLKTHSTVMIEDRARAATGMPWDTNPNLENPVNGVTLPVASGPQQAITGRGWPSQSDEGKGTKCMI